MRKNVGSNSKRNILRTKLSSQTIVHLIKFHQVYRFDSIFSEMGIATMLTQTEQIKMEIWQINAETGRGNDEHSPMTHLKSKVVYLD